MTALKAATAGFVLVALSLCWGPRSAAATPTAPNTLTFSGLTWDVKSGTGLGPGPNTWNPDNVFPMIPAGAALKDMIIERPKQKMAKPEGST